MIPNEENAGQGMFNGSAKVTQPSKQWSQNKTQFVTSSALFFQRV